MLADHGLQRAPRRRTGDLPRASVARMPVYHRVLAELAECGTTTVSSAHLAALAGVTPAVLRRDLSQLGSLGTRGVGYDVACLHERLGQALGLGGEISIVIVGIGNLGRALACYPGFDRDGFIITALIDSDPQRVGTQIRCGERFVTIRPVSDLPQLARSAHIGVIATPASAANRAADALIEAGVRSLLNFSPARLDVPEGVEVRQVDLSSELAVLAFHGLTRQPAMPTVSMDPEPMAAAEVVSPDLTSVYRSTTTTEGISTP